MYKVFINDKKILLTKNEVDLEKTIKYKNTVTLEMAIDLLQNTSCPEVNVFHKDIDELWTAFKSLFKNIDAAGGIVKNTKEEILFIERLEKWDLPKGKAEKGENIDETAVREVEEETGIDHLEIEQFINNTYHTYFTKKHHILKTTHWYAMRYNGNKKGTPQTEEGITAIDWKNKEQILKEVFPNTFENIIVILKEYWEKN